LSLDAEQPQAPPRGDAGRRALATISPATHLKLDGKLLARIYAGQITRWDDPAIAAANPGVKLPGTGIVLVHRGDDSGSTFLFTSYLNAQDPGDWSNSQVRAAGEGEAALGNSAGSYVLPAAGTIEATLASFTNTPAIETISLVNGSGARAYPIDNYEYVIVSTTQGSAVRARDLRAFLSWAITSGAAQLALVNFQPLPSSVVTPSGTQIAEIKG
jgi:phosphate transport system substrate-binding protein